MFVFLLSSWCIRSAGPALLLSLLLVPRLALADPQSDCSAVIVHVRTIQASHPITGEAVAVPVDASLNIDESLGDLKQKLEQLPFSSFKLLAEKEQKLSLREKDVLHLPNGQQLAFRPVYMDKKRAGLWLNWKDNSGSDILNTRIHFDSDDTVLTGTDASQDTGLILAIKAEPVAPVSD